MTPFNRTGRLRIDQHLAFRGRGSIAAALFDLGIYPAAVPAEDSRVRGEVYELTEPIAALRALDELEGYWNLLNTKVVIKGGEVVVDKR